MEGRVPSLQWRVAAQPDIVRAAQKDDLYLQQSIEVCHDVVRRAFGTVPALQCSRESKLAATLVYYSLTTGAGLQTLGEEYCDIMQMQGGARPAAPPARVCLALLKSFGPYLGERLAASLDRSGMLEGLDAFGMEEEEEEDCSVAQQEEHRTQTGDGASSSPMCSTQPQPQQQSPRLLQRLTQQLQTSWRQVRRQLAAQWPELQGWLLGLGRVHLALFYLYGTYYQASHRLLGMRYISISSLPDRRSSYRVLGVLLAGQLALMAASRVQPALGQLRGAMLGAAGGDGGLAGGRLEQQEHQHAEVLQEAGTPRVGGKAVTGSAASGGGGGRGAVTVEAQPAAQVGLGRTRQCPLCLSPRSNATCTPCGHVFCWHCVVQWCNEKPECPLCRSQAAPSQLVCLAHSDF